MTKEDILGILRAHEAELKAAGLMHLRLFGSVARDENTAESDVDLLFDSDDSDLHNTLRAYGFEDDLSRILGVRAHLSSLTYMRPEIKHQVLPETIDVF
ncbi:nucleotidyltransferase family protein [Granulicella tundricola]|uniref:DNA polymerase beta domain protein region n=1 Tax=Granulicella tundricola (strain ATCC BAA-1859 / DSM 23138 / MP5ACTX9) TaxID=1198114 RepID=E8X4U0_GRATM|nr:nucleotidyltransferase domain-containing protein [Granulicella tundricola]ADW70579.1 DNA polymerase beta domain protein region [Granulicella tundricola MP5ACTX9]